MIIARLSPATRNLIRVADPLLNFLNSSGSVNMIGKRGCRPTLMIRNDSPVAKSYLPWHLLVAGRNAVMIIGKLQAQFAHRSRGFPPRVIWPGCPAPGPDAPYSVLMVRVLMVRRLLAVAS